MFANDRQTTPRVCLDEQKHNLVTLPTVKFSNENAIPSSQQFSSAYQLRRLFYFLAFLEVVQ